jgi:hypothetical protein
MLVANRHFVWNNEGYGSSASLNIELSGLKVDSGAPIYEWSLFVIGACTLPSLSLYCPRSEETFHPGSHPSHLKQKISIVGSLTTPCSGGLQNCDRFSQYSMSRRSGVKCS